MASAPVLAAKEKDQESTTAAAPAPYTGPKKRVAVMDMNLGESKSTDGEEFLKRANGVKTTADVSNRLREMLTTALFSTGRFVLLERKNIDDVRQQIQVGQELGNGKTAVKRGGVLGAQALIRCAVTEFEPGASSRGGGIRLGPVTLGGRKGTARVSVDVRLYDASSSRILHNSTASGDSKSQARVEWTDSRVAWLVDTSGQGFQKLDVVRLAAAK